MHILMQRATPWWSTLNCSTKTYAREFQARGWDVTYVEDLIHPLHTIRSKELRENWKRGCEVDQGVSVVRAISLVPFSLKVRHGLKLLSTLH